MGLGSLFWVSATVRIFLIYTHNLAVNLLREKMCVCTVGILQENHLHYLYRTGLCQQFYVALESNDYNESLFVIRVI